MKPARPRLTLDILQLHGPWRVRKQLAERLEPVLPELVAQTGKLPPGDYVIAVALTDNRHQKALNRQFRGVDKPTNVLSFPQFAPSALRRIKPQKAPVFLGDIALANQYIVVEAKKNHKILINHIIHLVIHGILHILGYDHATSRQAALMEQLERKILDAMHIQDPYALPNDTGKRHARRKSF